MGGIGFLPQHIPVAQIIQRDGLPCHGAAHEAAVAHDAEISIEKLDLGFQPKFFCPFEHVAIAG